jgi:hypothetical protein
MPPSRRLFDLEKNLSLLYEKLGAMEQCRIRAYDAEAKISIEQRIRDEVLPDIHKYEAAYWQLLVQEANSITISEAEASSAITEVLQTVELIQNSNANGYSNSDEVIKLLTDIRNQLSEPGKSSAGKLKAAIPLFPPFVSYEVEMDTTTTLRRLFPTFSKLLKELSKAEKKK